MGRLSITESPDFDRIRLEAGVETEAALASFYRLLQQTFNTINLFTVGSSAAEVGAGSLWFTATPPAGWLICDGSAINRVTYAALFALLGTTYGAGDGVNTFNIPDLRGKFPLGKAAAGTGSSLAGTGGAIDHTHTSAAHTHTGPSHTHAYTDVPNHTHPVNITDPGHLHAVNSDAVGGANVGLGEVFGGGTLNTGSAVTGISATTSDPSGGVASGTTGAAGTGNTGSTTPGATGTNNPPFLAVHYIIKT